MDWAEQWLPAALWFVASRPGDIPGRDCVVDRHVGRRVLVSRMACGAHRPVDHLEGTIAARQVHSVPLAAAIPRPRYLYNEVIIDYACAPTGASIRVGVSTINPVVSMLA